MKLLTVNSEEVLQEEADDKHGENHDNKDAPNSSENHRWFTTGLKSWNQRRSTTWNLRVWIQRKQTIYKLTYA